MRYRRAILMILIIALFSILHLLVYNRAVSLKYEVVDLKLSFEQINQENRYLRYLISKKEDLSRIENIAVAKLKMEYPVKVEFLKFGEEK
jgi:cell division protein FtsL